MSKIVVVGSCNIDITVECDRWVHPGETIFGNRLTVFYMSRHTYMKRFQTEI